MAKAKHSAIAWKEGQNKLIIIFDISGLSSCCFADFLQVLEGTHGLGVVKIPLGKGRSSWFGVV